MKRALLAGAIAIALSPSVLATEISNQFIFSSSEHGNVCNQSPDVWNLGGELIVDSPITLNGKQITREANLTRSNSANFLLSGSADGENVHLMTTSVSCMKADNPFDLVGAVAALYETEYYSISKSDVPAEIPEPDLPEAPEIIKDQFETRKQFEDRVEKIRLDRQLQIAAIQQKYRQNVEARNEQIRQLQQSIEKKREALAGDNSIFVAKAFRDVMGKPQLTANSYDAEQQKMHVTFKASNQDYSRDVVLNVPIEQAREVYNSISDVDLSLVYAITDTQIELVDIFALYKDNKFVGDVATSNYQPEAITIKLQENSDSIGIADIEMQNPNLVDKFEVQSKLSLVKNNNGDELRGLLDSLAPAQEDKSLWFFNLAIEDYANSDEVAFARQSGEMMEEVALKALGVPQRHIYSLIDQQATSGAIKDKLRLMLDNIKEGDTVYFYYSGHGIPVLPDSEPYILPQDKIPDFIKDESFFKLNNIYRTLSDSKAGKIVAMVDSCFSGATDGVSVIKGVAASRLVPKKVAIDQERMVVLTAGRDKEYSNMYPEKGHRLFSYYLMKSVLEGKRDIGALYQDVFENVKSASFEMGDLKRQHPTVAGNKELTL